MEKLICSCCTAAIVPNVTQAFLTCEYCGTSLPNPRYDETAAAEAARPELDEICLSALREMGAAQNLRKLDPDCFGDPINGIDTARAGLGISDAHQVYFLYAHTFLLLAFSDGLALTDGGLYYKCDGGEGRLSWEAFVTGAISCTDRTDDQDGTLRIGSCVELPVKSDKDSRLARFLVDFHNHVYHLHTGETAPSAWAVTEPVVIRQAEETSGGSLLGTVLPAVGALLGGSALRRQSRQTIVKRTSSMHPTGRPTVRQDRRDRIEPPRPLHTQPHHRKPNMLRPGMPGSQRKPGSTGDNPRQSGGFGGGPRRPGGMGGPGKGRR